MSFFQELEEDRLLHSDPRVSEEERLRNTKKAVQARCRELQKQVEDQRLEIDTLRAQLEQARLQVGSKTFQRCILLIWGDFQLFVWGGGISYLFLGFPTFFF